MGDFHDGNLRHPTDFGLKELLWDSDINEDGFWEYFSKFEEENRAELAHSPLICFQYHQLGKSALQWALPPPTHPPPSVTTITMSSPRYRTYPMRPHPLVHAAGLHSMMKAWIGSSNNKKTKLLNTKLKVILENVSMVWRTRRKKTAERYSTSWTWQAFSLTSLSL